VLKVEVIIEGSDMMGLSLYISSLGSHVAARLKFSRRIPTKYGVKSFYTSRHVEVRESRGSLSDDDNVSHKGHLLHGQLIGGC